MGAGKWLGRGEHHNIFVREGGVRGQTPNYAISGSKIGEMLSFFDKNCGSSIFQISLRESKRVLHYLPGILLALDCSNVGLKIDFLPIFSRTSGEKLSMFPLWEDAVGFCHKTSEEKLRTVWGSEQGKCCAFLSVILWLGFKTVLSVFLKSYWDTCLMLPLGLKTRRNAQILLEKHIRHFPFLRSKQGEMLSVFLWQFRGIIWWFGFRVQRRADAFIVFDTALLGSGSGKCPFSRQTLERTMCVSNTGEMLPVCLREFGGRIRGSQHGEMLSTFPHRKPTGLLREWWGFGSITHGRQTQNLPSKSTTKKMLKLCPKRVCDSLHARWLKFSLILFGTKVWTTHCISDLRHDHIHEIYTHTNTLCMHEDPPNTQFVFDFWHHKKRRCTRDAHW